MADNEMNLPRLLAAIGVFAAVSGGSFATVRLLTADNDPGQAFSQASQAAGDLASVQSAQATLDPAADDRAKPRFEGDILGVYFTSFGKQPPDEYTTWADLCGTAGAASEVGVDWVDAGKFDLSALAMPSGWSKVDAGIGLGAYSCKGEVHTGRTEYQMSFDSGLVARVRIVRTRQNWATPDAPLDRISETQLAGRPAIVVKPVTPDADGSPSLVIIPMGDTVTTRTGFNTPLEEALAAAEAVSEQLKD